MYIVKIQDCNDRKIRSGHVELEFQALFVIWEDGKSINQS